MKLRVTYRDGDPQAVERTGTIAHNRVRFEMEGTTAVLQEPIKPVKDLPEVVEAVEALDFVQAVDLDVDQ